MNRTFVLFILVLLPYQGKLETFDWLSWPAGASNLLEYMAYKATSNRTHFRLVREVGRCTMRLLRALACAWLVLMYCLNCHGEMQTLVTTCVCPLSFSLISRCGVACKPGHNSLPQSAQSQQDMALQGRVGLFAEDFTGSTSRLMMCGYCYADLGCCA